VRLESALVVTEVALAVLLAAGSGVLIRSIARFYAIETGLNPSGVGVIDLVLPSDLDNNERRRILDNLVLKVRAVPGIENAALTQRLPLRGGGWSTGISVEGKPNENQSTTYVRFVSPGYFETMGISVKEGRTFDATDLIPDGGDTLVSASVINESLARKYFDGLNPIGLRVSNGFTAVGTRVVGIATDVAEGALTDDPAPVRYMPYTAIPFTASSQTLVFRTVGSLRPVTLLETVRRTIVEAAPRVAVAEATTMDQVLALAVGPARQIMTLVTLLTGLALLLGAIGIYGVMSHFVARRKRDWGIRIALGLNPAKVVSGVVGRGSRLVALGVVLGLSGFVLLGKFLKPLIYGIGPTDPAALAGATLGLLVVGVVAALLPATRASRTDPATVLREQ
jgi:predicted permease